MLALNETVKLIFMVRFYEQFLMQPRRAGKFRKHLASFKTTENLLTANNLSSAFKYNPETAQRQTQIEMNFPSSS